MQLTFELSREDIWQFAKFIQLRTPVLRLSLFVEMIQYAVIVLLFSLADQRPLGIALIAALLVGGISAPVYWWAWQTSRKKGVSERGSQLGKRVLEITDKGIREKTTYTDEYCLWQGVIDIAENQAYIFVFIDTNKAYLIPKRTFSASEDVRAFMDTILSYWNNAVP